MGQHADDIQDGTMCMECGGLNDHLIPSKGNVLLDPPGHPALCIDCEEEAR